MKASRDTTYRLTLQTKLQAVEEAALKAELNLNSFNEHELTDREENAGAIVATVIGSALLVMMIGMLVWKGYISDPTRIAMGKAKTLQQEASGFVSTHNANFAATHANQKQNQSINENTAINGSMDALEDVSSATMINAAKTVPADKTTPGQDQAKTERVDTVAEDI